MFFATFSRSRLAGLIMGGLALVGVAGTGMAQGTYPDRAIRMVVPYPPGGATDNLARVFTQELNKAVNVPVIIDNKPGGGTTVGALHVKNSPADGYTLLFQVDGLFNGKLSSPTIPYEIEDFDIVAPLSQTPYALLTPTSLNIRNLDDLKAHAMKNKGELTIGTLGIGVSSYSIMGDALARALGVKPVFIPYKGGAQGVTGLMAGEVDVYFATVGLARTLEGNDRVRILATTGNPGPNKFLKGVPSFVDLGIPDLQFLSLYGVAIHTATPKPIKEYLLKVLNQVTTSDAMKRSREQVSLEDYPGTLEDYRRDMVKNIEMYKKAYAEQKTEK